MSNKQQGTNQNAVRVQIYQDLLDLMKSYAMQVDN